MQPTISFQVESLSEPTFRADWRDLYRIPLDLFLAIFLRPFLGSFGDILEVPEMLRVKKIFGVNCGNYPEYKGQ